MRLNRGFIPVVCLLLGWGQSALGATYRVGEGSRLGFVAKITGSSFRGEATGLEGSVELDETGEKLQRAFIKVKASGFTTGMGQRDRHMNRKYIEVSKFPWISLELEEQKVPVGDGQPMKLMGVMSFHGVKKKMPFEVRVTKRWEEGLVVKGTFELNILDFGIRQPRFMVVKMEPVIKLEVTLALRKQ